MALTIENATIGYNANEVQTALNNLNTQCIDGTIQLMNQKFSELTTAVDNAWVGASAEQFKKNMDYDKDKIQTALRDSYQVLKTELEQIVNKMTEMDAELVKARGEQ